MAQPPSSASSYVKQFFRLLVILLLIGAFTRMGPWGDWLNRLEFDLTTLLPAKHSDEVEAFMDSTVVIYIDELSHQILNQPYDRIWDRRLHADLIDRLTVAGVKLIYFDLLFTDESSDPEADQALVEAISRHPQVVLVGEYYVSRLDKREVINPPMEALRKAANAHWGLASFSPDRDQAIRSLPVENLDYPSAPYTAASILKGNDVLINQGRLRFLSIGGDESVKRYSYQQVFKEDIPLDSLKDKVVFIGADQASGYSGSGKDTFATPYKLLGEPPWNGVDFHVLATMNYLFNLAIAPRNWKVELFIIAVGSLLLALIAAFLPYRWQTKLILPAMISLFILGLWYFSVSSQGMPFLTVGLILPPVALFVAGNNKRSKDYRFDLFISYSHAHDKRFEYLDPLVKAFCRRGLSCWTDRNITIGEEWRIEISSNLDRCRNLIIVYSQIAEESVEIFFEVRKAHGSNKRVIPILVDPLPEYSHSGVEPRPVKDKEKLTINLAREIERYQGIDLTAVDLASFDPEPYAEKITRDLAIPWHRRLRAKVLYDWFKRPVKF